ncbi:phosphatidylinositol phosphate synthase [Bifidobacterium tsurumiense]|uniref:Phosphatidylinositol phosphate synthase n=1 Tax=Bifidobacterium tsurumiense TaxID=356829 RepID=A0A087EEF2_9BIFI|nr:CDP-alcohol phosphatidyltransferase family protein [Bifidobacterium tsurumiense]KFJ06153.1 CDP-diacylglycerol--glycerol-3-phosphate 3-phosphatidyltransferase [Bifidobacterium tsurumiense]MDY4678788.1 CDP-alcohol phosphatidyltransferase family protein [Bifidobacterium tsurumiense]MSS11962.1 CDP-alcohol phosphatidyltransferase family protein [Bifidobacterium tsurumiense]
MLEHLRAPLKRLIEPIAKALISIGLTADAVTVIGSIGTIVVALLTGITGRLFPGALILTFLVLFDSLDGSIAALTTGGTRFGAFLDSTLDRIADWALLAGLEIYFVMHGDLGHDAAGNMWGTSGVVVTYIGMFAALYGIMTSVVTSYARARAESLGCEAKEGIAARADRLLIILLGMAIADWSGQDLWLSAALILLCALGTITVIQRIMVVRSQLQ